MTEAEALELVDQRWKAVWEPLHPGFLYAVENELFRPQGVTPFANLTMKHAKGRQLTQGEHPKYERAGTIVVELYGDVDQGRNPLSLLVGDVRKVFESWTAAVGVDPFWAATASTAEGGRNGKTTDGRYWRLNVVIPFKYFETK